MLNHYLHRRWDEEIQWHWSLVTEADPAVDPLTVAFVRDQHLRALGGSAEDDYIDRLIRTSDRMAERATRRAHSPQTLALVMDRFPRGGCPILIPRPSLMSVTSIVYIDPNGNEQTIDGSPEAIQVSAPVGPKAAKGRIAPLPNTCWPQTQCDTLDAVTITFQAGYPLVTRDNVGSPTMANVPEDILHGRLLVIGELYKQRSESVQSFAQQAPALVRANDLWLGYRAY